MYKEKKILALIPARGGSKGLPRKNILPLAGKPLIAWTIIAAQHSGYIDRIVVSTDDAEIAAAAKEYGAEVPFVRPADLAQDTSPTIDAVFHALDFFKGQNHYYDYLAILESTSPLRKKEDIDDGIRALIDAPEMDALITLGDVTLEHPRIVKKVVGGLVTSYSDLPGVTRRQDADSAYFPYGVLYLAKVEALYREKTVYSKKVIPFYIDRWQRYEIDDDVDFFVTEQLIKKYHPLS